MIGDVSDKGLPAALFMALTFSLVRAETKGAKTSLQVLQNVNRNLINMNDSSMFVTFFIVFWIPEQEFYAIPGLAIYRPSFWIALEGASTSKCRKVSRLVCLRMLKLTSSR